MVLPKIWLRERLQRFIQDCIILRSSKISTTVEMTIMAMREFKTKFMIQSTRSSKSFNMTVSNLSIQPLRESKVDQRALADKEQLMISLFTKMRKKDRLTLKGSIIFQLRITHNSSAMEKQSIKRMQEPVRSLMKMLHSMITTASVQVIIQTSYIYIY